MLVRLSALPSNPSCPHLTPKFSPATPFVFRLRLRNLNAMALTMARPVVLPSLEKFAKSGASSSMMGVHARGWAMWFAVSVSVSARKWLRLGDGDGCGCLRRVWLTPPSAPNPCPIFVHLVRPQILLRSALLPSRLCVIRTEARPRKGSAHNSRPPVPSPVRQQLGALSAKMGSGPGVGGIAMLMAARREVISDGGDRVSRQLGSEAQWG
ncbi:hypothetical protein FIBSPDRAFT_74795 [Athelia psychrophila]|uniref:Uncharacterized protein n=1 Tax=Athelia psychrophila TaxID=1759441 RepID=A0A166EIE3_9AGAM|nr:hypothetical protein FIBSPDRAFT_74795 [Fibularhizoctonia sp. CBS 109695]